MSSNELRKFIFELVLNTLQHSAFGTCTHVEWKEIIRWKIVLINSPLLLSVLECDDEEQKRRRHTHGNVFDTASEVSNGNKYIAMTSRFFFLLEPTWIHLRDFIYFLCRKIYVLHNKKRSKGRRRLTTTMIIKSEWRMFSSRTRQLHVCLGWAMMLWKVILLQGEMEKYFINISTF